MKHTIMIQSLLLSS